MGENTRKLYRLKFAIGLATAVLLLFACNFTDKKIPSVDKVPELACRLLQSPTNILSEETPEGAHKVTLNYSRVGEEIEKLAHITQLNIQPDNTLGLDSLTFEFNQLHFHSPSEHSIDGVPFPLEMHVVSSTKKGEPSEYLVIAILFERGDGNRFLGEFIEQGPVMEASANSIHLQLILGAKLFQEKMNIDLQGFYNYKQAHTTSRFTENVNWLVVKRIFEVSPDQILKIKAIQ